MRVLSPRAECAPAAAALVAAITFSTGSMVDGTAVSNSSPMALTMYSGGLDASTSKLSGTETFKVTRKDY